MAATDLIWSRPHPSIPPHPAAPAHLGAPLGSTPLCLSFCCVSLSLSALNLSSRKRIKLCVPNVRSVFGRSASRFAAANDCNTLKLSLLTSFSIFKPP